MRIFPAKQPESPVFTGFYKISSKPFYPPPDMVILSEKSPKKFRGVFVNRMQNYCLDTLECLLEANFIRMDAVEKKTKREELQKEAIVKLKLLGYVSMVAENSGCILKKQYKQISIQLSEAINLTVAWKKSDDERWKKRS